MVKESLPSWVHQDSDEGLVHVNVGGLKRSLCSSTLKKFPDTRLGKLLACDSEEDILQVGESFSFLSFVFTPNLNLSSLLQVCDDYDVQQKEFYFDRNPGLFPYVLHFYQTGKLHIMEELCVFSFRCVSLSLLLNIILPLRQTLHQLHSFQSQFVSVEFVSSTSFFSFSCLKRS